MSGKPDDRKFRELILYVAERCQDDPGFALGRLNKILFLADFLAFARIGKAITNQEYQKLEPGPAPRRLKTVLNELLHSGEAVEQVRQRIDFEQRRVIAIRQADLAMFTGQEIAIVDEVIDHLRHKSSPDVSWLTNKLAGWQAANLGDTIPYSTALINRRALTDEERAFGRQLARELELPH